MKDAIIQKYVFMFIIMSMSTFVYANPKNSCLDTESGLYNNDRLNTCIAEYQQAKLSNNAEQVVRLAFTTADIYQHLKDYVSSNDVLMSLASFQSPEYNTFAIQHKLLREIGKNHYYLKNNSEALSTFQKAFDLAEVDNQLIEMGLGYNDLGVVYKAQSRYIDSLNAYLQSLKIKEALNLNEEVGNTLNNIGNMYILMGDYESAYTYHNKALQYYRQQYDESLETHEIIIHAKSQIGVSLEKIEGIDVAIDYLEKAIADAAELNGANVMLFDTYCALAGLYLTKNMTDKAEEIMLNITDIQKVRPKQDLLRLMVLSQISEANNEPHKALFHAKQGLQLAQQIQSNEEIILFHEQLAVINALTNNYPAALAHQTQYIELKESYLLKRYDSDIKYLQNEVDLQEQQKDLDILHQNNRIQELMINKQRLSNTLIILFNVLLLLFIVWFVLKKSRERKKLVLKMNYHRKKLKDMQTPKENIQTFFESIKEPLICLDQMGIILFCNEAFIQQYEVDNKPLSGQKFGHVYPSFSETLSKITLDSDDMPQQQQLVHHDSNETPIYLWVNTLNFFDNAIVISFLAKDARQDEMTQTQHYVENANIIEGMVKKLNAVMKDSNPSLTNQLVKQLDEKLSSLDSQKGRSNDYRLSLVNLMSENLEVWRKTTQGDRISLAEHSCLWRVSIDEGRLRTRAMDRYLSLKLLPKSPRWRPVVKTTHYILSECKLSNEQRKNLNQLLEIFMANLRCRSLQN